MLCWIFLENPKLYPQSYHKLSDDEWPVFCMALKTTEVDSNLMDFIVNFREYYLDHRLVIYDLGLTKIQRSSVSILISEKIEIKMYVLQAHQNALILSWHVKSLASNANIFTGSRKMFLSSEVSRYENLSSSCFKPENGCSHAFINPSKLVGVKAVFKKYSSRYV